MSQINVLLVYGSGGHNEQMRRLYDTLSQMTTNSTYTEYISLCDDDVKHPITHSIYTIPTVTDKFSYLKLLIKFPIRIVQAYGSIRKIQKEYLIQFVITTGPGIGVLAGFYFKYFSSARIIHIETWSRFYSKSLTGRAMYYLADDFIVQNKELLQLYPKAIYKGRL